MQDRPEYDPIIDQLLLQLGRMGFREEDLRYCLERLEAGVPAGADLRS